MEDILTVYTRPYDPQHPVVTMDETSKQLVAASRSSLPARPGEVERYDYEYVRKGVADLFLFSEPLRGWRTVQVTDRRAKTDWAQAVRAVVEEQYPKATCITLVCDNLNTHTPGALYEAFPPEAARRLLDRLDLRHTPKHGSWLNVAEIELSVLSRQCLEDRMPDRDTLATAVAAWYTRRNAEGKPVEWHFTTADARLKLKHLYPSIPA